MSKGKGKKEKCLIDLYCFIADRFVDICPDIRPRPGDMSRAYVPSTKYEGGNKGKGSKGRKREVDNLIGLTASELDLHLLPVLHFLLLLHLVIGHQAPEVYDLPTCDPCQIGLLEEQGNAIVVGIL